MKEDGRKRAPLPKVWNAVPLTFANKGRLIKNFERSGYSLHSKSASTLAYIIEYCERNRIPYELQAQPGLGYFVKKVAKFEFEPEPEPLRKKV